MNYEEKYNAALERAKKLQETCDSTAVLGWCEYINEQSCQGWIEDVEVDEFVDKLKKDFGL